MLTELRLQNFQGFAGPTNLRLAPLTFIFGPNSAGKSSIIRSLLLLKQSLRSIASDEGRATFVDSDADLGGFANTVHRHETDKDIGIGVTMDKGLRGLRGRVDVDFSIRNGDFVSGLRLGGELFESMKKPGERGNFIGDFSLSFTEDPDDPDNLHLSQDDILGSEHILKFLSQASARRQANMNSKLEMDDADLPGASLPTDLAELLAEIEYWRRGLFATVNYFDGTRLSASRDEEHAKEIQARRNLLKVIDELLQGPAFTTEMHFRRITHLGGLRAIPDRVTSVGSTENKLASDASNIVAILGSNPKIASIASALLERLSQGTYELELVRLNDRSVDFLGEIGSLVLRDKVLKTTTTFKDVGVGLSQVLPIITLLAQASALSSSRSGPRNSPLGGLATSVVLMEQPELHLHPRMQAELLDVILENSLVQLPRGPQVIMETHSESFILRLQRRMREGRISPEKVSVLFIDKDKDNGVSCVKQLELDDNGEFLTAWPESFGVIRLDEILP